MPGLQVVVTCPSKARCGPVPLSGAMPASRVPLATMLTPSLGPGSLMEQPSSASGVDGPMTGQEG